MKFQTQFILGIWENRVSWTRRSSSSPESFTGGDYSDCGPETHKIIDFLISLPEKHRSKPTSFSPWTTPSPSPRSWICYRSLDGSGRLRILGSRERESNQFHLSRQLWHRLLLQTSSSPVSLALFFQSSGRSSRLSKTGSLRDVWRRQAQSIGLVGGL